MAYLRLYTPDDPEQASREIDLHQDKLYLGRHDDADIRLLDPTVSRYHALIRSVAGGHVLEDANSRSGTKVNNERIATRHLAHGDTINIAQFVLEYRTDEIERTRVIERCQNPLERKMRMAFRRLPETIELRYRVLDVNPGDIFAAGDTLAVGEGGILQPDPSPPAEAISLEVMLTPGGGTPRVFLGEVLAVLKGARLPELCIKLHNIDRGVHEKIIKHARRGPWVKPGK